MLKRRRKQKTDYAQRFALLKSGKPRLVIRRSLNNIHIQLVITEADGDKTVIETMSKSLRKYGWKGHCSNLPAAYLTGYIAGINTLRQGIKEAVIDIGLHMSVESSNLYAAAAGAKDAGLRIPIGKVIPQMDRITGKHIADYAQKLKSEPEKYKRQFSGYLSAGLQPEDLPKHFEAVKERIDAEFNVTKKVLEAKN